MEWLTDVQAVVFLAVAVVTVRRWIRERTRPAAYVAGAFGGLALLTLPGASFVPTADLPTVAALAILALFPWLLTAFAWSFEGPLPSWLRAALPAVVGLAAWGTGIDLDASGPATTAFIGAFLLAWTSLAAVAAVRLARSGGRFPLVRARMRTLAAAVVILNAALLLAGIAPDGQTMATVLSTLAIASAVLFVVGFAPPPALRSWWRRLATAEFDRLQTELIAATTEQEVADAAVPRIAAMIGGGVALLDRDGRPLAQAALDDAALAEITHDPASPDGVGWRADRHGVRTFDVDGACLVIRATPYTPMFGRDEDQLTGVLARQIAMAYERTALQAQALRAREELQALLLGLAHDLRNPAVAIKGFADLLLEDPPDRLELTTHLQRNAIHLHRLIDALLELARVGRTDPRVEPVDLVAIAQEVTERAGAAHPQAHLEVRGQVPLIDFDPLRATQLLDNLLGNALTHGGRPDLHLVVEVAVDEEGTVTAVVADDGVGVRPSDRERIFDVFQRGQQAGTGGNGLGLSLVRRIAETAGGTVHLDPSAGSGARFVVTLPGAVSQVEPVA